MRRRLAVAAAAGFFSYCALSVLFGPAGMTAYAALEERKAAMKANLEELAAINERLAGEMESLMSDPERAAAEARSLCFLRKCETAVLLGGAKGGSPRIEIGNVLPFADPPALADEAIKAISLGVSLAVMAALLVPGLRAWRPSRRYRDRFVQSASLE